MYDALGRRIAKQRLSADATTVAESDLHVGRRHPVRTDHVARRIPRFRRPDLGPRRREAGHPGGTPTPRPVGGRLSLLRDRHGPGRDAARTRRRAGQGGLAHPGDPVGYDDVEPQRHRVHTAALPRPVPTPSRAPLQPPPPHDPGRAAIFPDPLGLVPAPNAVAYVDNPTRSIDPLGLAGCPHRNGEHRHSVLGRRYGTHQVPGLGQISAKASPRPIFRR
nr:hypothetical protein [Streptomyces sp. SJL17-1]